MKTEHEINRENALELSRLILENPKLRVVAWINSEGIGDENCFWRGNMGKPEKQFIVLSEWQGCWIEKDGDDYEDCYGYYGADADNWDDDELERKAKEIPWEEVIAVNVSIT